ncbi:MAG TPA: FHA domain-containing protein [Ktedonobacteraceae bacterium]|nr:FHA domain-containing protein [Ktedonobacteraceae bacterium]
MLAITVNTLYTSLRKRGTTRQLTRAIVLCVLSVLLLLLAFIWYNLRFTVNQAGLSMIEVEAVLTYIALSGWIFPLSISTAYCLYTQPQLSSASMRVARLKWSASLSKTASQLPRYQPGVLPLFVYSEDTPWGWLEYRSGNFQGQRLALKRQIATIGRGEDNDIWVDDEMASRHHAELAWHQNNVYLTDCGSLNGIFLNGRRVRATALVKSGDLIEVGAHSFTFIAVEHKEMPADLVDPLVNHKWRSAFDEESAQLPVTGLLDHNQTPSLPDPVKVASGENPAHSWDETAEVRYASPLPQPDATGGTLIMLEGPTVGQSFLLDRQTITVGRGHESDIVIQDTSISRRHVQFSRQGNDDYIHDLGSRNGTRVNDEPLNKPRLLKQGDIISMGNISLEYVPIQHALTTLMPMTDSPPTRSNALSGPIPLRLPSKTPEQNQQ